MKILVTGSGGREHALVWKLAQSTKVDKIYCAPGNPGIANNAICVDIKANDIASLVKFATSKSITLVIPGSETTICNGITDAMEKMGILVAGPTLYAAQLESSKSFAKIIMQKLNIPTPKYEIFDNPNIAKNFIYKTQYPLVIKTDGLAEGKGVFICKDITQAVSAIELIITKYNFGQAGNKILIEEMIEGEEISFLVFTDGKTIIPMPSSQDHKTIGENNIGPNTGGMGAYSPVPIVNEKLEKQIIDEFINPIITYMTKQGHPYKGILYAGLIIDKNQKIKILEFNIRFGDPECQVIITRLESDLAEIFYLLATEKLNKAIIKWSKKNSICVVLTSKGYPGEYKKGQEIHGISKTSIYSDTIIFHAGTSISADGKLITNGGRVLGVTTLDNSIDDAIKKVYKICNCINWEDMYLRHDIGYQALNKINKNKKKQKIEVGIVMGSKNDWITMQQAVTVLKSLDISWEAKVLSAHRTPNEAYSYAQNATKRGLKVIITGAGMAAHLAGIIAASTILPVIGVPLASSFLNGFDSLLAIVQMPTGVPVATVSIGANGAQNAAWLAAQILAINNPNLADKISTNRLYTAKSILSTNLTLE